MCLVTVLEKKNLVVPRKYWNLIHIDHDWIKEYNPIMSCATHLIHVKSYEIIIIYTHRMLIAKEVLYTIEKCIILEKYESMN